MTLLVVHHTRKQEADDAVDKISDTTGLIGCADGSLILEKPERLGNKGTLIVTSRESADMKLNLEFDRDEKIWKFLGYADAPEEDSEDPILIAVASFLKGSQRWTGTATELLAVLQTINPTLNAKPNTLVRRLNAKTKELLERYGILYSGRRVDNVKYLVLEVQSDNSDMYGTLDAASEIGNIGHIAREE